MKKMILFAVLVGMMISFSLPASARGIEKGDQTASIFFGGAVSVSGAEIDFEAPWGTASSVSILEGAVSYGAQYLYALNPYIAVGAEFNANNFESTTDTVWGYGYEESLTSKMDVYSLFVAGRLTTNPSHVIRFYIPFGLGVAAAKSSMTANIPDIVASGSETDYPFIYYAGLGVEGNMGDNWIFGREMRYSKFSMDTSKLVKDGGDEDFSFLSFLFKLSYRF